VDGDGLEISKNIFFLILGIPEQNQNEMSRVAKNIRKYAWKMNLQISPVAVHTFYFCHTSFVVYFLV
jgi:hypothetical protein